jgi:hypothetical protein
MFSPGKSLNLKAILTTNVLPQEKRSISVSGGLGRVFMIKSLYMIFNSLKNICLTANKIVLFPFPVDSVEFL